MPKCADVDAGKDTDILCQKVPISTLLKTMTQRITRLWQLCLYLDLSNLLLQLLDFSVDFIDVVEEAKVGVLSLHKPLYNGINVLHACNI